MSAAARGRDPDGTTDTHTTGETGNTAIHATALRNTRALEQHGLQQIEHQLSGLGRYPQYRSALEASKGIDVEPLERLGRAPKVVGASIPASRRS